MCLVTSLCQAKVVGSISPHQKRSDRFSENTRQTVEITPHPFPDTYKQASGTEF